MENVKLFEKVKELITPYVDDEDLIDNIEPTSLLTKDLNINSAYIIDVILDFEETFKVEIDDETASKMETVGDIINALESLKVTA